MEDIEPFGIYNTPPRESYNVEVTSCLQDHEVGLEKWWRKSPQKDTVGDSVQACR